MSTYSLGANSSAESIQSSASVLSTPDSLAPALTGPMVWAGSELKTSDYIVNLGTSDIEEIRSAVIAHKSIFCTLRDWSEHLANYPLSDRPCP